MSIWFGIFNDHKCLFKFISSYKKICYSLVDFLEEYLKFK